MKIGDHTTMDESIIHSLLSEAACAVVNNEYIEDVKFDLVEDRHICLFTKNFKSFKLLNYWHLMHFIFDPFSL